MKRMTKTRRRSGLLRLREPSIPVAAFLLCVLTFTTFQFTRLVHLSHRTLSTAQHDESVERALSLSALIPREQAELLQMVEEADTLNKSSNRPRGERVNLLKLIKNHYVEGLREPDPPNRTNLIKLLKASSPTTPTPPLSQKDTSQKKDAKTSQRVSEKKTSASGKAKPHEATASGSPRKSSLRKPTHTATSETVTATRSASDKSTVQKSSASIKSAASQTDKKHKSNKLKRPIPPEKTSRGKTTTKVTKQKAGTTDNTKTTTASSRRTEESTSQKTATLQTKESTSQKTTAVQKTSGISKSVVEPTPRFAYVFVVGGCDPERPAYRNYVYSILVATKNLRDSGSTVDVVVLVQMDAGTSETRLPDQDAKWFESLGIKTKYLPKAEDASFYRLMQDKFRILGMTEYDRCLYMDADVMPLGNLDYLFRASMDGLIRPNLIIAGSLEPANGGFFMLAPNKTHVDEMHEILERREREAKLMIYPHFDIVKGWGHEIVAPDQWETNKMTGQNWTFWAAFADQGLLYHWTKYHRRDVTIVLADRVENWVEGPGETVVLQETLSDPFTKLAPLPVELRHRSCKKLTRGKPCLPPYSDFVHFTGTGKPWFLHPQKQMSLESGMLNEDHYWWWTLDQLNQELKMGLDLQNWTPKADPESAKPLHGVHPVMGHARKPSSNLLEYDEPSLE